MPWSSLSTFFCIFHFVFHSSRPQCQPSLVFHFLYHVSLACLCLCLHISCFFVQHFHCASCVAPSLTHSILFCIFSLCHNLTSTSKSFTFYCIVQLSLASLNYTSVNMCCTSNAFSMNHIPCSLICALSSLISHIQCTFLLHLTPLLNPMSWIFALQICQIPHLVPLTCIFDWRTSESYV